MQPSDEKNSDMLDDSKNIEDGIASERNETKLGNFEEVEPHFQNQGGQTEQYENNHNTKNGKPNNSEFTENSSNVPTLATKRILEAMDLQTSRILHSFEQKLAYDATKQQQIDKLHAELQKHRTDLIAKTNRPLVNGLIKLYEDIGKLAKRFRKKPAGELEPSYLFKLLSDIQDDIEILLDQNGVVSYSEEGDKFEPRRQRAVRKTTISDENLIGTIAERISPGFEQGDDLIKKESVDVYVIDKISSQQVDNLGNNELTKISNASDLLKPNDKEEIND